MNNILALQPTLPAGSIEAYIHAVNEIPMIKRRGRTVAGAAPA